MDFHTFSGAYVYKIPIWLCVKNTNNVDIEVLIIVNYFESRGQSLNIVGLYTISRWFPQGRICAGCFRAGST